MVNTALPINGFTCNLCWETKSVYDILSIFKAFSSSTRKQMYQHGKRDMSKADLTSSLSSTEKTTAACYSSQYMFIIRDVYRKVCELLLV